MNKVGVALCYLGGHLHEYFDKFLLGCKYNPTIDWLLFTDDHSALDYPENVKVYYTTIDEVRERARIKLAREICIDSPRGLCNYKVMYGAIFEEELKDYDYWGYCDCDLVFGDLRAFLTDDIFEKYGKIGMYGHFTLLRNDEFYCSLWKDLAEAFQGYEGVDIFKEGERAWSFDEVPGIDRYFDEHGLQQYSERICESYQPDKVGFISDARKNYGKGIAQKVKNMPYCHKWRIRKHVMFEFDHGKMYRISLIHEKVCREEIMYAHFPGGKKFKNPKTGDHFYIIPYEFTETAELTPQWIRSHSEEEHLAQSLRLGFIWYRGVAAKYLPGVAKVVKRLMGRKK